MSSGVGGKSGDPISPHTRVERATYASRDGPLGETSTGSSRGCCQPTDRLPVVDMTLVSERTRPGCSIAIVWAIIPPIDTPTTWAESQPEMVEQADGVAGQVAHRVRRPHAAAGEGPQQRGPGHPAAARRVERPVSRLS